MQICPSQRLCNAEKTLQWFGVGMEVKCGAVTVLPTVTENSEESTYVNWPSSSQVQVDSSEKPGDGFKYCKQWGFCHFLKNWIQRIKGYYDEEMLFQAFGFKCPFPETLPFPTNVCLCERSKPDFPSFSYKQWDYVSFPVANKQRNKNWVLQEIFSIL